VTASERPARARIVALGQAPLMHGFALLGIDTRADASAADLEALLAELWRAGSHALVLVEQPLAAAGGPWLARVRQEAARIVIAEIPSLHAPQTYAPAVDALVRTRLGAAGGAVQ
jgi:vacuolar-type H+-ATPase subunit F/Vma7